MRINNNMLALNTHRQLGGVSLAQAKSMEKLSSGYRINRAGDDAAGLAISEKMRAQLRGLTTAAKNAQDGISLIQTAEGALQEVHGMLNRMVELATQSANGTMDDEVDRKNIEAELTALKDEITRVAKASNFNGIELLDGSLASSAVKAGVPDVQVHAITGSAANTGNNEAIQIIKASDSKFSGLYNTGGAEGNANLIFKNDGTVEQSIKMTVIFTDDAGEENRVDIDLRAGATEQNINWSLSTIKLNGNKLDNLAIGKNIGTFKLDGTTTGTHSAALDKILGEISEFDSTFKRTAYKADGSTVATDPKDVAQLKLEAKNTGTLAEVKSIIFNKDSQTNAGADANTTMADVLVSNLQGLKQDKITVFGAKIQALISSAGDVPITDVAIKQSTVRVDGENFILVEQAAKNESKVIEALEKYGFDKDHIIYTVAKGANATTAVQMKAEDAKEMAKAINKAMGKEVVVSQAANLVFEGKTVAGKKGEGLTLQVGESSEAFQKINVKVGDMSAKGLGIKGISVATQEKAAASISKIKDAINNVSSTRGDLGALQNRLEHTIANLNVTAENITASESRIRDVDMAKEMVELTKLNILQQAAQAMLAQANQAPQGVLQLLR